MSKSIGDCARHQRVDHVADRLRVEQADARAHQQRHGGDGEARELRSRQRDDAADLNAGAGPALAFVRSESKPVAFMDRARSSQPCASGLAVDE